jgi:serine/threonine protein kinase
MEGVGRQGTERNKYRDEELAPPNEDIKVGTLKRPKNPTLEVDGKFNSERQHTEKPVFENLLSQEYKRDKPSIESEKLKKVKLENDESEEAVDESEVPMLNAPKKFNSFESFDRKEEAKLEKVEEQKIPLSNNGLYIKSAKTPIIKNEKILKDREQLIKYTKEYIKEHNELPQTTLDYYEFVRCIGKGAFGKVTLGIHKLTGKYVAIKTIDKALIKDEFSKRKVFQEVYILKKIRHSNIIRLLEVFESNKHYLMVMEFAGGGDLLHFIKKRGRMQESDAKFIFKQIVYGLAHVHWRSVIHRDIKLDNILLDWESGVKICDFGVSKIIKKGQVIKEQCGTPAYIAPEIITDEGYQGFFVDVWSLGVLLYAMVCGTVPFKAPNMDDLHKLIKIGEFCFPCELSEDAKKLINGWITLDPFKRLTIPEILTHEWLKETNDDSEEETEEEEEKDNKGEGENKAVAAEDNEENKEDEIDLKSISGNINFVNVDNLFYQENYKTKLSYTDYCWITEDFTTHNLEEEALKTVESFGYPRNFVLKWLNNGHINHATASYYLLVLP